ncbi:TetR/AcrR family transcriptional regulator [Streptomyces sp. NPDC101118]|uniref:TetR/AcrR family transcriptional regulator n=1 Tax=Streptomyces sp. NPDC101118 TaxID=3366109 RepID=UPI00382583BD
MTPVKNPAGGAKSAPSAARRSEASRRAILTAAVELAGEVGYAKLGIEAIAARAGVGKQTIYRWWPSKGAVLLDAVLMLSGAEGAGGEGAEGEAGGGVAGAAAVEGGAAAEAAPGLPDTGDLEADLKTVLRATAAELADPAFDGVLRALTTEVINDPALADAYAERLQAPLHAMKRGRLLAARAAGQLAGDVDLDVAVDLIWGPLTNRWLQRGGPLTAEYADRVVETALRGLRPA